MKRLAFVAFSASLVACAESLVGPEPARDPRALFDFVWRDFDRFYASFEARGIDWSAAYDRHRPVGASETELLESLTGLIAELNDNHVSLYVPAAHQYYSSTDLRFRHSYFAPQFVPLSDMRGSVGSRMRAGLLAPGVGYLYVRDFMGSGWVPEFDAMLAHVAHVAVLVIDVRDNGGGTTDNSTPIAGRFFRSKEPYCYVRYRDGPGHGDLTGFIPQYVAPAGDLRFDGDVIVLTNGRDVSTAEDFVLAMRARENVLVYGAPTAGGYGNPLTRELPNGWTYRLPMWVQYDRDRVLLRENEGLVPDVFVQTTREDSLAGRDPVIARLLLDLGSRAGKQRDKVLLETSDSRRP